MLEKYLHLKSEVYTSCPSDTGQYTKIEHAMRENKSHQISNAIHNTSSLHYLSKRDISNQIIVTKSPN